MIAKNERVHRPRDAGTAMEIHAHHFDGSVTILHMFYASNYDACTQTRRGKHLKIAGQYSIRGICYAVLCMQLPVKFNLHLK